MKPAASKKRLREFLSFRHIRTKLLVSYVLILILPFTFLSVCFIRALGEMYVEQKESDTLATMQVLSENLRYTLGGVSDVLSDFCSNIEVWNYLCHDYRYPDSSIEGYYNVIRPKIDNYKALHPEILEATVYTRNETIITNTSDMQFLVPGSWEEQLMARMDANLTLWTLETRPERKGQALYAVRIMRPYGKTVGLFSLKLNTKSLMRLLGEGDNSGSLSIVREDGCIVLSTSDQLMGHLLQDTALAQGRSLVLDGILQQAVSTNFLVRHSASPWQLIQTSSVEDVHLVARTNMTLLTVMGISMLTLMCILAVFFSHGLTTRLSTIRKGIAKVEEGDFSVSIAIKGKDEIAALGGMLNHMVARLDALVTENARIRMQQRELELAQREAQLNALQSQINPHFLFNSLEAILYGIRTKSNETEHVVQMLARNLRRLASWEHETTCLQDELLYIDEYLQIQKFRYGDLLRYVVNVEPELMNLHIPNLLLQPLVENAVTHGIAMKSGGGTVTICGRRDMGKIILSVEDDGAGMNEVSQEELRQSLSRPVGQAGPCIGLKNVYDRIRLYYAEKARFIWESKEGEYTRMTLILLEEEKRADNNRG